LIIGGSRGIGKACALELAEKGFDVGITYKASNAAAENVKKEIESTGKRCDLFKFDISNSSECFNILTENFNNQAPDVLVYNAGITKDNLMVWMSQEEWDSVIHTNLDGFYNVTKPLLFGMIKAKKGRIIVISSASGQMGQAGQVNYSASKAGLIGAAKSLAREVGKRNILVNVVSPGFIETDMTSEIPEQDVLPLIPLKRIGKAEDVASVVGFLSSEKNMYIHGQVIGINGGLVI